MKFSLIANSFHLVTFWSIPNRFSGCFVFILIFIEKCEREIIDVEIIKLFRGRLSEHESARDNYLQLSTVQWIFDTCSCFLLEYPLPRQRLKGAFKRTAGATRAISATSQQVILVLNFTRPHAIIYTRRATYFLSNVFAFGHNLYRTLNSKHLLKVVFPMNIQVQSRNKCLAFTKLLNFGIHDKSDSVWLRTSLSFFFWSELAWKFPSFAQFWTCETVSLKWSFI